MTLSQEKMVGFIKDSFLTQMHGKSCFESYEIKEFDVKEIYGGVLSLYAVSGLIGDEGTLAAAFCRNRIHIFIGKRGGISYYNKEQTMMTGKKWNLFSIYYNQKY